MNTQTHTSTHEHAQRTAAKGRLRRKFAFALPLLMACSLLSACWIVPDGRDRAPRDHPEFERETLEILTELTSRG